MVCCVIALQISRDILKKCWKRAITLEKTNVQKLKKTSRIIHMSNVMPNVMPNLIKSSYHWYVKKNYV